jgi:hypothetical protein
MKNRCIFYSILIFMSVIQVSEGQVLKDSTSLRLLRQGVDEIYNMRFDKADELYKTLNSSYPDHPVVMLFKGIILYWENYPMIPSTQQSIEFENILKKCIREIEKTPSRDEAESLLANLCARGLLLTYYSDNDLTSRIRHLTFDTYKYIRRSFRYTDTYPDFFYFTGLYNYYREAYPELHPIYKPLALLFPKGNKQLGLKQLNMASENSIFLKAESASVLAYISAYFENDMQLAAEFGRILHERYPLNIRYTTTYIRDLLLIKKYDEAEKLMGTMSHQSPYYKATSCILNGIIMEKKYNDYKAAQDYYNEGTALLDGFGLYGNEFKAYGYFGLSRLSALNNDTKNQKLYRKKALDLSDSGDISFDN